MLRNSRLPIAGQDAPRVRVPKTKKVVRRSEEGTIDGLNISALADELDPEGTDVFGFSMYIWNHHFMLALAAELKRRNPSAVMVFGGSQAGGYGARLLKNETFSQEDYDRAKAIGPTTLSS